jgi:hypothetical protein
METGFLNPFRRYLIIFKKFYVKPYYDRDESLSGNKNGLNIQTETAHIKGQ